MTEMTEMLASTLVADVTTEGELARDGSTTVTIGDRRFAVGDERDDDGRLTGWTWTEWLRGPDGDWEDVTTDGTTVEHPDQVRKAVAAFVAA